MQRENAVEAVVNEMNSQKAKIERQWEEHSGRLQTELGRHAELYVKKCHRKRASDS